MRLLFQRRTRGVRSRRFFVPLDEFVAPPLSSVRQLEIGGRVSLGGDPPFDGPDRRRVAPGELVFRVELFGPVERHLWRALSRMLRANAPWFDFWREGRPGTIPGWPPAVLPPAIRASAAARSRARPEISPAGAARDIRTS